jgi:hypothetical protein
VSIQSHPIQVVRGQFELIMLSNLFHIKILIAFINPFEYIIPLKDRELSFWPTQGIIGSCTFIGSIKLN